MKLSTHIAILEHFKALPPQTITRKSLSLLLSRHRTEWKAPKSLGVDELTNVLLENDQLKVAELSSTGYGTKQRYILGTPSVFQVGTSFYKNSFLSHGTALYIHGLAPPGPIYVNHEQSAKVSHSKLTQTGLDRAFRNKQRLSNYVFNFADETIVFLNGKHTDNAGVIEMIEQHKKTPHFVARFGLGLPARSPVDPTPGIPTADETRYVQQLFEAYSDNKGRQITISQDLPASLHKHFNRSRESFYSAEALRNFSRDNLPSGEFENLQEQIYTGVADTCEGVHACGLTRLIATTNRAADLSITSSPLMGKTEITDLHGICHQLANVDRLTWVVEKEGEDVDS